MKVQSARRKGEKMEVQKFCFFIGKKQKNNEIKKGMIKRMNK